MFRITSICLIFLFLGLLNATITHAEYYKVVKTFGSYGPQFKNVITGIATDSSNNVYISSESYATFGTNGSVSKFDRNGNLISWWIPTQRCNNNIAIDASNNIYLSGDGYVRPALTGPLDGDFYHIYSNSGSHIKAVAPNGIMQYYLYKDIYGPGYIAVDNSGDVYVNDFDADYATTFKFDSLGNAVKQLSCYGPMVVDSKNNLYVAGRNGVTKFDSNGNVVKILNSTGYGPAQFLGVTGIAVDAQDNIYVDCASSINNQRIQKLDRNGNFVSQGDIPKECNIGGGLSFGSSIAIDGSYNIYRINITYVNNTYYYNVIKLSLSNSDIKPFITTPSKIRISDNVQFNASQSVDMPNNNIFWEFGDGTTDASGKKVVNHNYSEPGSYTVNLTVTDSTGKTKTISQLVNVSIPVVLVHGWRSSSDEWNIMENSLKQKGFEVWNYNYKNFNTFNPQFIAPYLSNFIENQRNDLSFNGQKYTGKIDIVCHSMGSIVSRYYMEVLDGGIHGKDVRQWIGIAPAHHGSALADLHSSFAVLLVSPVLYALDLYFLGPAVNELKTTSDSVQKLGPLSPKTKYRVIAGWNPTYSSNFGGGIFSATLAKRTSGSGPLYYWTHSGDMIIATAQSYDANMGFDAFPIGKNLGDSTANEFDHTHICKSPKVIDRVVTYLKNINTPSLNNKPDEDEVPFDNLNFKQKIINGILGVTIQEITVPVPGNEVAAIVSNTGQNLQLNSNSQSTLQGTVSSPDKTLVTLLEWDDGDINMTLTSPSGRIYSAYSHPNDTWYTNEGKSLNYIVNNPESGNWSVKLTSAKYPGYDIHYNLTYVVRNIIANGSSVLPVANLTTNVTQGYAPLAVQFNDTSNGAPTSWKWSFGDGKTSTDKNPVYTYSKAGKYTVSLTVTNAAGSNTTIKSNYITVTMPPKPVAAFSASPLSGKKPLTVTFTDKSTGSPSSWSWDFGDKTSSTDKNPTHKYTKAGKYTVSLTVKNAEGSNTKKISNYITVK